MIIEVFWFAITKGVGFEI